MKLGDALIPIGRHVLGLQRGERKVPEMGE